MVYNERQKYGERILVSSTITIVVVAVFGLVVLLFFNAFLALIGVTSGNVAAASYSASVSSSGEINLNVSPAGQGANLAVDNVNIVTDCPAGYTLSISGPVDNTLYKNGDSSNTGDTKKISASSGTVSNPVSILGDNINTWGYTSEKGATINSNFIGLVSNATTLTSSNEATGSGGDDIAIYYGVSVDAATESGLYTLDNNATITYYLTTPITCQPYTIVYDDNDANSPTTMSVQHVGVEEDSEITLFASNYQRSGYGFAGWSTEQLDPDSNTFADDLADAVSDGLVFGTNAVITVNNSIISKADPDTHIITFYAIWVKSSGNLQGWSGCSEMDEGDIIALKDIRDDNVYTVAKLADGHCWMAENMRLSTTSTMTNADTNNPTDGYGLPTSNNDWCTSITAACYNTSYINTNNTTNTTIDMSSMTDSNIYSYGNYYNWRAVTAGNGTYEVNNSDAVGDICPAGWHLPTGGTNGNYAKLSLSLDGLNTDMNATTEPTGSQISSKFRDYPYNYVFSGRWDDDTLTNSGLNGRYWTKTPFNNNASHNLYISEVSLYPAVDGPYHKRYGFSARCLLSEGYTVSYNSNDGSGTMDDQFIEGGEATNLNANQFVAPVGYKFAGWNTEADGSGDSYANGESVTDLAGIGGSITLYAQWEGDTYTIEYDKNANDATGVGAYGYTFQYQGGFSWDASTKSMNLRTRNYERDGYGFAGWSVDPNVAEDIGTGDYEYIYGPEERFTTSDFYLVSHASSENIIKLYAVWIPSAGNLQNWSGCSGMSVGDVTALTDTRDGEVYAVGKLVDGKCWVIENYRLDPGTANITADNTNSPTADFVMNAPGTSSASSSDWCNPANASCTEQILFSNDNTAGLSTKSNYDESRYGKGMYYNWYTAMAGNGLINIGPTSAGDESTEGDLCPAGWHIPTGGPESEMAAYVDSISQDSSQLLKYPNNFVAAGGIFEDGTVQYRDSWVSIHSSTEHDPHTYNDYNLVVNNVNSSNITVKYLDDRFKGRGVPFRCISNT